MIKAWITKLAWRWLEYAPGGFMHRWHWRHDEGICRGERACLICARNKIDQLRTALQKHHDWHQQQGEVAAPDGAGGYVTWDAAMEYGDSSLCDETVDALHKNRWPVGSVSANDGDGTDPNATD